MVIPVGTKCGASKLHAHRMFIFRMYDHCGTLHLPLLVKEMPFYTKNVIRKPGELPLVELKALLVRKGIKRSAKRFRQVVG